jgi:nucleotide-binding universal stress UspA family protein
MSNNRRILIAVDRSHASRRAVEYASEMIGAQLGFHVSLLHLELPPRMLEWGGSEDASVEAKVEAKRERTYLTMEDKAIAMGRVLLQPLEAILAKKGIDVSGLLVEFEEPLDKKNIAGKILDTAREHNCGTIVVGRHSFSGLQRLFQHHVGEELVREGEKVTIWVVE